MPKAVLAVVTDCPQGREAEFNRWYDDIHVPDVLQIPGFVACTRYEIVGEPRQGQGRFLALYELEADDISAVMADLQRTVPQLAARGRMFDGLQVIYMAPYQPITDRITKSS